MSLLDDARRMLGRGPDYIDTGGRWCGFCDGEMTAHARDCPWLAMPQIVAALEAAQALVNAHTVAGVWRVVDDPPELGEQQHAALVRLWEFGIRPDGQEGTG